MSRDYNSTYLVNCQHFTTFFSLKMLLVYNRKCYNGRMKDYMKTIAKQLRKAREEAGFSQEDLGKRLGMSSVNYGDFERGKLLPSINYLTELGTILSKPLTYFLEVHTDHDLALDEVDLLKAYRVLPIDAKRYALGIIQDMAKRASEN